VPDAVATPLRRTSLRDQAFDVIRHALVSGQILPGDIYSASALATRLGVSTSPVREAMLTLVNQGLMEAVRNRGYRVVAMSEHDLDEVHEMRLLLEVPGAEKAAAQVGDTDLAALEEIITEIEAAATDGDIVRFLDADRRFHLDLLGLTGNRRLVDTVGGLRDQTRLYGLQRLARQGGLVESAREHRDILAAITARDTGRLGDIMREHLRHVRVDWSAPGSPDTTAQ
jgi:DNA-binding GntR family transcriptional regulator